MNTQTNEDANNAAEEKAKALVLMRGVCRYFVKRANANKWEGPVRDGLAMEFLMGAATMAKVAGDDLTAGVTAKFAAEVVGSPLGGAFAVETVAGMKGETPDAMLAEIKQHATEAARNMGLNPDKPIRVIRIDTSNLKGYLIAFLIGAVTSAFICQFI